MGTSIALLYRYSQSYFNEELKKYGLGNGQHVFLLYLLEHEGINQETLAHMVKIDKTTAARAIAKLVEAGYVKRTVSDSESCLCADDDKEDAEHQEGTEKDDGCLAQDRGEGAHGR